MDSAEVEALRKHLENSREVVVASVTAVPNQLWTAKPSQTAWSPAECAEHIVIVERLISARLAQLPTVPEELYDSEKSSEKDASAELVADRSGVRVQAPPPLSPTGAYGSKEDFLADFEQARNSFLDLASQQSAHLRGRFFPHPVLGKLDGYQWFIAASAHSIRHARQIAETHHELSRATAV